MSVAIQSRRRVATLLPALLFLLIAVSSAVTVWADVPAPAKIGFFAMGAAIGFFVGVFAAYNGATAG